MEAGVDPRFVQWQGDGPPAALALSRNLHRRHLDESQRALVAARLARLLEEEAAKRQGRRTDLAAGAPAVAAKARALRRATQRTVPAPSCPGSFGMYPDQPPQGQPGPAQGGIVLLWVGAGGLADAIQALQARGFRYTG